MQMQQGKVLAAFRFYRKGQKMTDKRKISVMTDEQKMTVQLWLGVVLAVSGIALLAVSFCVPPLGVIDASVLAAVGEVFTFSGALIGIDYTYKYKRYRDIYERQPEHPYPHGHAHPQYDAEPVSMDETGEGNREDNRNS